MLAQGERGGGGHGAWLDRFRASAADEVMGLSSVDSGRAQWRGSGTQLQWLRASAAEEVRGPSFAHSRGRGQKRATRKRGDRYFRRKTGKRRNLPKEETEKQHAGAEPIEAKVYTKEEEAPWRAGKRIACSAPTQRRDGSKGGTEGSRDGQSDRHDTPNKNCRGRHARRGAKQEAEATREERATASEEYAALAAAL